METAVDLEQYKIAPIEADFDELGKINRKLEELANDCFEVEKEARTQLLHQKALYTYPKLDTNFLSLSNEREWEYGTGMSYKGKIKINVPRFSVHRLDEPEMIMRFYANKFGGEATIISPTKLPKMISIPLIKTIEFFDKDSMYINSDGDIYLNVKTGRFNRKSQSVEEALSKYQQMYGEIEIKRSFNGLIPQENKVNIREAQKVFGNKIFLFAEAKPEDWNVSKYIADPIVAGVIKENCFYVDKFNTTPLEEFVKTGFSQTN